jgi:hypothetical protein
MSGIEYRPGDVISYRPTGQGAPATGEVTDVVSGAVWVRERGKDVTERVPLEYVIGLARSRWLRSPHEQDPFDALHGANLTEGL